MKDQIYRVLVNRVPGIRERYRKRQKQGKNRWLNLMNLLWLNVQYYLLFRRSLGQTDSLSSEVKILCADRSESSLSARETPEQFAKFLLSYDVISFDVFNTLIFRTFSDPTDVFFLVGMELCYPDFKQIRIEAEQTARQIKQKKSGTCEVTLSEIWEVMERESGIAKETGMQTELAFEKRCCYANPYLLQVVQGLKKHGKKMIVTSDMYLSGRDIQGLLISCGYDAFDGYFVSSEYGCSKSDGGLYQIVRDKFGSTCTYLHIGDNEHSDYRQPHRYHMDAIFYPNVNSVGDRCRTEDLSAITGSLYRGLVNAHLHSGLSTFSREYEYGYVYGGLFVAGYCRFIHAYVRDHEMEKVLFLARDGAILLQAYRQMYPAERETTEYVYWSRLAAVKLSARYYKKEYFSRFLFHKVDQGFTVQQVLQAMELSDLLYALSQSIKIEPEAQLTYKNVGKIKKYLMDHWDEVLHHYDEQIAAGRAYFTSILEGCKKAAAVDIGWLGSGAVMLQYAANQLWGFHCSITGILAGTASCPTPQVDASEPLLLSGQLVSYFFSQQENRDLWKFHNPAQNHNLYWELLLGAPEGSLKGFYFDEQGNYECRWKENHSDVRRIQEIHRGILDFVSQYQKAEERMGHTISISGRDAYAPMLYALHPKNKPFMDALNELTDEAHITS